MTPSKATLAITCLILGLISLSLAITKIHPKSCQGYWIADTQQCVTSCSEISNTKFIDITRTICVADCSAYSNQVEQNGYCVCAPNYFINFNGDSCVQKCTSNLYRTQLVSIEGRCFLLPNKEVVQCTADESQILINDLICVCNRALGYVKSSDGTQCVQTCQDGQYLNLLNSKCEKSCSLVTLYSSNSCTCVDSFYDPNTKDCIETCSGVIDVNGITCLTQCIQSENKTLQQNHCVCSTGYVLAPIGDLCISSCPSGTFLSLLGDKCLWTSDQCGSSTITFEGKCVCDPSSYFINFVGDACSNPCPQGQFDSDSDQVCQCDNQGQSETLGFLNLQGTDCVLQCPDGQYLNMQRTQCVKDCTPLSATGSTISIKGQSYSACVCEENSFLNLLGNACITQCPQNQQDIDQNKQCECKAGFYLEYSGSQLTCIDSCINNNLNSQNTYLSYDGKWCVNQQFCVGGTFTSDIYDGQSQCSCPTGQVFDGANCIPIEDCTGSISLNELMCLKNCGTNQQQNGNGQCQCKSQNYITFGTNMRCISNCLVNLDNLRCAQSCPQHSSVSSSSNQCECDTDFVPNYQENICYPSNCNPQSNDNQYLSLDGTYCVTNCTKSFGELWTEDDIFQKCVCIDTAVLKANQTTCLDAGADNSRAKGQACDNVGQLYSENLNKCVLNCLSSQVTDFYEIICMTECPLTFIPVDSKCVCPQSQAFDGKDPLKQICSTTCSSTYPRILGGQVCGTSQSCGQNQQPKFINDEGQKQCFCISPYFIDSPGLTCVKTCQQNEKINLKGDQCTSIVPTNSQTFSNTVLNWDQYKCQTGFIPESTWTNCVQPCPDEQYLNFNQTACVTDCSIQGTNVVVLPKDDTFPARCGCNYQNGEIRSSNGSGCTNACGDSQSIGVLKLECVQKCQANQYQRGTTGSDQDISDTICFCDMTRYYTNNTEDRGTCIANNTYCPQNIDSNHCRACYQSYCVACPSGHSISYTKETLSSVQCVACDPSLNCIACRVGYQNTQCQFCNQNLYQMQTIINPEDQSVINKCVLK